MADQLKITKAEFARGGDKLRKLGDARPAPSGPDVDESNLVRPVFAQRGNSSSVDRRNVDRLFCPTSPFVWRLRPVLCAILWSIRGVG
jgi:hypothetical protein